MATEQMVMVQVRMPLAVHQALKIEAKALERSVNWLANKILAEALAKAKHGAKQ